MSQDAASVVPPEPSPQVSYTSSVPPPPKPSYASSPQPLFPLSMQSHYPNSSVDYPIQQAYPYPQPGQSQTPNPLSFLPPAQPATAGTLTSEPAGVPSTNIADLFNSLLKAGIVSTTGTPLGAGSSAAPNALEDAKSTDLGREATEEYERNIMSMSIALTTSDLTKCVVVFQCISTAVEHVTQGIVPVLFHFCMNVCLSSVDNVPFVTRRVRLERSRWMIILTCIFDRIRKPRRM